MKQIFNRVVEPTDKEVDLFRKFAKILAINYKVTFIKETHQNYVWFDSVTLSKKIKKEISDLWIIMYSPSKREARMTFLQVKSRPINRRPSSSFIFEGDFFQHELLSKRPIVRCSSHQFPDNILSFTNNSSIGSFGVFYLDCYGDIDLAYAVADSIKCKGSIPNSTNSAERIMEMPYLGINEFIVTKDILKNEISIISTLSIDTFTGGILNLMIGAEIHKDSKIMSFLSKSLSHFVVSNPGLEDFIKFTNTLDISFNDNIRGADNLPNIALINIDRE